MHTSVGSDGRAGRKPLPAVAAQRRRCSGLPRQRQPHWRWPLHRARFARANAAGRAPTRRCPGPRTEDEPACRPIGDGHVPSAPRAAAEVSSAAPSTAPEQVGRRRQWSAPRIANFDLMTVPVGGAACVSRRPSGAALPGAVARDRPSAGGTNACKSAPNPYTSGCRGRRIMAITLASQAKDVGSIPIARSTFRAPPGGAFVFSAGPTRRRAVPMP